MVYMMSSCCSHIYICYYYYYFISERKVKARTHAHLNNQQNKINNLKQNKKNWFLLISCVFGWLVFFFDKVIPAGWCNLVGECDCRHDACAALRLADIKREIINSTCGSCFVSAIISCTFFIDFPCNDRPFHSITSSPIRKFQIFQK